MVGDGLVYDLPRQLPAFLRRQVQPVPRSCIGICQDLVDDRAGSLIAECLKGRVGLHVERCARELGYGDRDAFLLGVGGFVPDVLSDAPAGAPSLSRRRH